MSVDKKTLLKLREQTGAGLNDCQQALEQTNNNIQEALDMLRKKGAVKASKKLAERVAKEGLIESYIHPNGKVGVLIEVNCETDFVAKNEEFKELVHDLAMQVAAASPDYISFEDIPKGVLDKEKEIYREQLKQEKKPAQVMEKIIAGKLEKFYAEACLLNQPFIKDDKMAIADLINTQISKLGEKIVVKRFIRYQI